ncbi:MAG TPA: DUF4383 domain-containing protein [Burkholderiales bacterium]|nr:DUF4383 domain-containing protein [Burkholderiales bacterium]
MTGRAFALAIGIVFLAIGVLGFISPLVTPAPEQAPDVRFTYYYGYLFGILPVNYFVNLVHMAMGAWGITASRSAGGSRAYAKTIAVISGALAIVGLVPALNTLFGLAPVYGNDVWLHAIAAIAAAFFGWLTPRPSIFAEDDVALKSPLRGARR